MAALSEPSVLENAIATESSCVDSFRRFANSRIPSVLVYSQRSFVALNTCTRVIF